WLLPLAFPFVRCRVRFVAFAITSILLCVPRRSYVRALRSGAPRTRGAHPESRPSRASNLDDQFTRRRDAAVIALPEDRRGTEFLHDRRTDDARTSSEVFTVVDRATHWLLGIEVDVAVARGCGLAAFAKRREFQLGAFADNAEPHVDHFHRLIG